MKQEFEPGSMENTLEDVEEFLSDVRFEDGDYSMMSTMETTNVTETFRTPNPNHAQTWGDVAEESTANKHKADPFYRSFYQDRIHEQRRRRKRRISNFSDSGVETDHYLADISETGDSQLEDIENNPETVDESTNADTSVRISQINATSNAATNSQVAESTDVLEENLTAIKPATMHEKIGLNQKNDNEAESVDDSDLEERKQEVIDRFCQYGGNLVHAEYRKEGDKNCIFAKYEIPDASVTEQTEASKIAMTEDLSAEIPNTSSAEINKDKTDESLESLKDSVRLQGAQTFRKTKNYEMDGMKYFDNNQSELNYMLQSCRRRYCQNEVSIRTNV